MDTIRLHLKAASLLNLDAILHGHYDYLPHSYKPGTLVELKVRRLIRLPRRLRAPDDEVRVAEDWWEGIVTDATPERVVIFLADMHLYDVRLDDPNLRLKSLAHPR